MHYTIVLLVYKAVLSIKGHHGNSPCYSTCGLAVIKSIFPGIIFYFRVFIMINKHVESIACLFFFQAVVSSFVKQIKVTKDWKVGTTGDIHCAGTSHSNGIM